MPDDLLGHDIGHWIIDMLLEPKIVPAVGPQRVPG